MSNLKQQIIDYRNSHTETRTLLGTVLGELDRITKEPSDEQCVQLIKKMIESNRLMNTTESLYENQLLEQFIPKQLTEGQIEIIVRREGFKSIKDCMTFFKEQYAGLYNGQLVSKIFKNL
jgi:uncharacterized protein YqeY